MARGVDDDLLASVRRATLEQAPAPATGRLGAQERRELVRHDSNPPARSVGRAPGRTEGERLRRRRPFSTLAEGTARGLVVDLRLERFPVGARTPQFDNVALRAIASNTG